MFISHRGPDDKDPPLDVRGEFRAETVEFVCFAVFAYLVSFCTFPHPFYSVSSRFHSKKWMGWAKMDEKIQLVDYGP